MGSLEKINNVFKGDKTIWIVFFLLCVISIVEVYSASSSLGYRSGNYWSAAMRHGILLLFGMCVTVVFLNIKCRFFKPITSLLSIASFLLIILVFFFGTKENDASRWLAIGPVQLQPSEFSKAAMVFVTANILSKMQTEEGASPRAIRFILLAGAFLILPIAPENLSTALLLTAVVIMMMLIGRVPLKQIGYLISGMFAFAAVAVLLIFAIGDTSKENEMKNPEDQHLTELTMQGQSESVDIQSIPEAHRKKYEKKEDKSFFYKLTHRVGTWKSRILGFADSENVPPEKYDLDKKGQVGHSRIAIVESNYVGRGPGNSVQRDFLPQAYSDFIYAIIIEELGLEGAAFVALLYIIILFRTYYIARKCKNPFPAYLAMGVALLMVTQALFNMCVAVGIVPVTGQPLPLISRGGTSSIINCMYIGVILSISRTAATNDSMDEEDVTKVKPSMVRA